MSTLPDPLNPRSYLRLLTPEEFERRTSQSATGDDPPDLSADITWSEFFEHWMLPFVLRPQGASEGNIRIYRDALTWWDRLTGGPTIRETGEQALALFEERLAVATYRRGKFGRDWPLSAQNQHKIKRTLNAIFHRAGPKIDRRKTARLLGRYPEGHPHEGELIEAPYFVLSKPPSKPEPKPPFTLKQARLIAAEAAGLQWGPRPGKTHRPLPTCSFGDWMQAFLAVLYYTGLRVGTVLALRWSHVDVRGKKTWLDIPPTIVTKTHKGMRKFLHPQAVEALQRIKGTSELLLPCPYCYDYLAVLHKRLQHQAGIPASKVQSPHAWRRTHGTQMCRVGMRRGIKIAQSALDHADDDTTRQFYVRQEPMVIRRLPLLLAPRDPQQLLF